MYPFLINPKEKETQEFELEYAYVEDFLLEVPPEKIEEKEEETHRGVVIIDL